MTKEIIEFSDEEDGSLSIEFCMGEGKMLAISVRSNGYINWVLCWDKHREHGTHKLQQRETMTDLNLQKQMAKRIKELEWQLSKKIERAELGVDGNCGFALLGYDLVVGESEFVEIDLPLAISQDPNRYHNKEWINAAQVASTKAYLALKNRLADRKFLYYLGESYPLHNKRKLTNDNIKM